VKGSDDGWNGWSPAADASGVDSAPSPASWGTAPALDSWGVGAESQQNNEVKGPTGGDIRNNIGLKPTLVKYGDTFQHYNWDDPYGRDRNEELGAPSYLETFIMAWMDAIPQGIVVSLRGTKGRTEHWRCDINTNTGFFMAPVEYPETTVDHSKIEKRLESRRLNGTSMAEIQRRFRGRGPRHTRRWSNTTNSTDGIPWEGAGGGTRGATGRRPV
jgi:hypothetical protein